MKVIVTEMQSAIAGLEDEIWYPGLTSCACITVRADDSLHALHLALPFDAPAIDAYAVQIDEIRNTYFNADAATRSLHLSYDPTPNAGRTSVSSYEDIRGHVATLRQLKQNIQHIQPVVALQSEYASILEVCALHLEELLAEEPSYTIRREGGAGDWTITLTHWTETRGLRPNDSGGMLTNNIVRYRR